MARKFNPSKIKPGDWITVESEPDYWTSYFSKMFKVGISNYHDMCPHKHLDESDYPVTFQVEEVVDRDEYYAIKGGGFGWSTAGDNKMRKLTKAEVKSFFNL